MYLPSSPFNEIRLVAWNFPQSIYRTEIGNVMVNIYHHPTAHDFTSCHYSLEFFISSLFFPVVLGFYYFCFMCERVALVFSSSSTLKKNVTVTFIIYFKGKTAEDLGFQNIILIAWLLTCFENFIFLTNERTNLSQDFKSSQTPN